MTVIAVAAAGCGAGSSSGSGAENRIVIAQSSDPGSLNVTVRDNRAEMNVSENVTERLLRFDPEATGFEPVLATSWKQIDPLTVELKLREGVKFTNGEPFNAESAVYSLDLVRNANPYKSMLQPITTVEAVDDYTIRVKTQRPSPLVMNGLAYSSYQFPKKYYTEVGGEKFGVEPIGTGPFVLKKWNRGESIQMTANPDYWAGKAKYDELDFKIIPDPSSQIAALQSGEVDLVAKVEVGSFDAVASGSNSTLVSRPGMRCVALVFNQRYKSPLSNPKVRQALWHAIDVRSLIDQQLGGKGELLEGQMVTPNFTGYVPDTPASVYDFDPDKTKQMLAEAGYPDGFTIDFKYAIGLFPQDKEIAQVIAGQLEKVGIKVKQTGLEAGAFLTEHNAHTLRDMYMVGYLPPPDASFMYDVWRPGPDAVYQDAEFGRLLDETYSVADPDKRQKVFEQLVDRLREDPPWVPLFQSADNYGVSKRITGFTPHATQLIVPYELEIK
ncbi:ABC transporter substrate-binding protein [Streptosporangium sp. NBC_01755]|uniref:ABC transporter substrate-binding protein n=1 Tax=unclassified Streptosporangium TaxID=2632669 RepID=UPI002DDA46EE|nr:MULTISPECIES: ABC transporter substrate-binding protein [unclassified Streptosporangium]WSA28776.1 ABC transporter substrate-binding protein [Streptosporangium sp. NBC_01810]WSC99771.1 ABC transporter substrate-binding protein [Streptosporangium sp. NBC_01755]